MAIFTAIGTALATSILGSAAAGTIGFTFIATATAAALQVAAGIGVSLIGKALSGQEDKQSRMFSTQVQLRSGEATSRSIGLGFYCTAGSLAYYNTWGESNKYLTQVIAYSDVPSQQMGRVMIDDSPITFEYADTTGMGYPSLEYRKADSTGAMVDHLWVKFYDGNQTVADPFLVASVSSADRPYASSRVGRGVAYVIVTAMAPERSDGDEKPLFQGNPSAKLEIGNGVALYNPLTGQTGGEGDHNPVVQLYNILRGIKYNGTWLYGLQTTSDAQLPKADWNTQIAKADAIIAAPGGGSEPTYRAGGELQVNAQTTHAIDALLTAMQGRLISSGGIYKVRVGEPDSPIASISDADILSTEEQSFIPFLALADTINGISLTWPEPSAGWAEKAAPPIIRTDLEAKIGGRRLMASVALDMVPYAAQAQRLGLSALAEAQRERRHTIILGPEFWKLEPGDVITWASDRNGYDNKLFRIDGYVDKENLDVILAVTEVDPSDYDWNPDTDFQPIFVGPTSPTPATPLPMAGWQVYPAAINDDQGRPRRPSIGVRYDGSKTDVQNIRVQVRVLGEVDPMFDGEIPYGAPYDVVLQAQFTPLTKYEVRGIYVRNSGQQSDWSDWLGVTTLDIRLWDFDLYEGVIGFDTLAPEIVDLQNWIGDGLRETIRNIQQTAVYTVAQDHANYLDKQQIRTELHATAAGLTADYTNLITVGITELDGELTSLSNRTETLETALPGKADSSTVSALDSRVTSQGEDITSQGSAITAINVSLTGKASASSVTALQSTVSTLNGQVTANSNALISLNSTVGDISADAKFRAETYATPAGAVSRIGFEVRAGTSSAYKTASLFLDVLSGAQSRVFIIADQFVVASSASAAAINPFIIQAGVVYIDTARIRDLTVDNLKIANGAVDTTSAQTQGADIGVAPDGIVNNIVTAALTSRGGNNLITVMGTMSPMGANSEAYGGCRMVLFKNGVNTGIQQEGYADDGGNDFHFAFQWKDAANVGSSNSPTSNTYDLRCQRFSAGAFYGQGSATLYAHQCSITAVNLSKS